MIFVVFDLPATTKAERRSYTQFRKGLISLGYSMVQESVYALLVRSSHSVDAELLALDRISPKQGHVLALPMTLAQFKRMIAVSGEPFDFSFFSDDVVLIGA